jgi:hypothetical protein
MALRTVATAGGDRLLFLSLGAKQLRRPGDIMVLWKRSLTRRSRKADRARRTTGSRTSCCQSHASFTRGQTNASPLNIKGGSRMLECRTSGSVHGVPGNGHPYRNPAASWPSSGFTRACCCIRQRSREDNKYHTIARLMAGLGRLFRPLLRAFGQCDDAGAQSIGNASRTLQCHLTPASRCACRRTRAPRSPAAREGWDIRPPCGPRTRPGGRRRRVL